MVAFDELRAEWNELLRRSSSDCVFSTWEWQSTWWQIYHPGKLWVIECRDGAGRLVGLAPWFIDSHAEFGRVVRSIGCVEVTDYLDVIVDREFQDAVLECLARFLVERRSEFDLLDLCNLPEGSVGQKVFPG